MNNSQQMAFYNERNKIIRLARLDAPNPPIPAVEYRDETSHPGYLIRVGKSPSRDGDVILQGLKDTGEHIQDDVKNNPNINITSSEKVMPHVFTALRNLLPAFDKLLPERQNKGFTALGRIMPIHTLKVDSFFTSPKVKSTEKSNVNTENQPFKQYTHSLDCTIDTLPEVVEVMSKLFGSVTLQYLLNNKNPNPWIDEIEDQHGVNNPESYLAENNTNPHVPQNLEAEKILKDLKGTKVSKPRRKKAEQESPEIARKHAVVEHLVPHLQRYLQHIFDTGKDHDIHDFFSKHHEGKPELMQAFSALLRGE